VNAVKIVAGSWHLWIDYLKQTNALHTLQQTYTVNRTEHTKMFLSFFYKTQLILIKLADSDKIGT